MHREFQQKIVFVSFVDFQTEPFEIKLVNIVSMSSNEAVMSGWFDSKRPLALSIGMTGISVFCIAFPVKQSPNKHHIIVNFSRYLHF